MKGVKGFQKGNKAAAGKQKKTLEKEKAQELFFAMVEKEKAPIFQALIDEAKKGNVQALKEIFERWWGKVKDQLEHSGEINNYSWDYGEYKNIQTKSLDKGTT